MLSDDVVRCAITQSRLFALSRARYEASLPNLELGDEFRILLEVGFGRT